MRPVIKVTLFTPDRETDACPACRATDLFACGDNRPDDYCRNDWHFDEVEHELPAVWEICSRCRGNGTIVNPNIDGNGITSSEMEELGDEFMEDYMGGVYDVTCDNGCGGSGKVLEVAPTENLSPEQRVIASRYEKQRMEMARDAAEDRHTRFMEDGGRWD